MAILAIAAASRLTMRCDPTANTTAVRVGIAQWCLDKRGPDGFERACRLGIRHVQLDLGGKARGPYLGDPGVLRAYEQATATFGVTIIAIAGNVLNDIGLTAADGTVSCDEARAYIAVAIEAAQALSAPFVFFPSFRQSKIRSEQALQRTAATLRWACARALSYGISIGSENSLDAAGNLHLARLVAAPNFRVVLDTYNPAVYGRDVASFVRTVWSVAARQIHAKDGRDRVPGNTPLGAGDGGFVATAVVLNELGFDGYLVLENDYSDDAIRRMTRDLSVIDHLFPRTRSRIDACRW